VAGLQRISPRIAAYSETQGLKCAPDKGAIDPAKREEYKKRREAKAAEGSKAAP